MSATTDRDHRAAVARGASFSRLLRPASARLPVAVFLAAAWRTQAAGDHVVGGVLLVFAAYGVAAILNDLRDLEIDRANGRALPLATGALDLGDARAAAVGCLLGMGLAQLLLAQPLGGLVTLVAVLLSAAYSHPAIDLESRGVQGTALLACSYLVLPLALAGPMPSVTTTGAILLAGAAMLLYKDVKDEVGDRLHGKRTPLIRWGIGRLDAVATALLAAAVVLAGARWPTFLVLGALVAQRRMVASGTRAGRSLLVFQVLVVAGAIGLAAV